MIILNSEDVILESWRVGCNGYHATIDDLKNTPSEIPVAFRGMTKRSLVNYLEEQNRDFYYIDTGYLGNLGKRKDFHRVVKNNVQHLNPVDVPSDRLEILIKKQRISIFHPKWRKGSKILVVTPSGKPCKYYGITRDDWLERTLAKLEKYTDREIIIRDKPARRDRVGNKSIYNQFIEDDIYAVVTYNSIAATEAVGFGIPAFADAPNAAQSVCLNDFTMIETPYMPDRDQVRSWLQWLAYGQYTIKEFEDGTALSIIKEYNL